MLSSVALCSSVILAGVMPIIWFASDACSEGLLTGMSMALKFAVIVIPPKVQKEDPSEEFILALLKIRVGWYVRRLILIRARVNKFGLFSLIERTDVMLQDYSIPTTGASTVKGLKDGLCSTILLYSHNLIHLLVKCDFILRSYVTLSYLILAIVHLHKLLYHTVHQKNITTMASDSVDAVAYISVNTKPLNGFSRLTRFY